MQKAVYSTPGDIAQFSDQERQTEAAAEEEVEEEGEGKGYRRGVRWDPELVSSHEEEKSEDEPAGAAAAQPLQLPFSQLVREKQDPLLPSQQVCKTSELLNGNFKIFIYINMDENFENI